MRNGKDLRVLQVLPAMETGGVERGTVEMAKAITLAGGAAIVASAGGRMVTQLERAGGLHVPLSLMTKDPVNILVNAGRLTRLIRSQNVTIIHARSRAPAWSAWLAARRTKAAFVTTWHGVYGEDFPGKHSYNAIMARGDIVIAISHYVAAQISNRYAVPPGRLRIIPRGVDPAHFDPDLVVGERVHKLAQAWRIPPGARVVMLPARLTRWKGAEILLDAVAALRRDDICVVLVGDDQGRTAFPVRVEARARRLGLDATLRLAGHCDDMPAAMMLADIVVSASLKPEPFGRTVIEAQAMRRPVVAFDHGGAAETLTHQLNGLLAKPGDAASLSACLAQVLDMPQDQRAMLGERARQAVLSRYTTQAMQTATLEIYAELLGQT